MGLSTDGLPYYLSNDPNTDKRIPTQFGVSQNCAGYKVVPSTTGSGDHTDH